MASQLSRRSSGAATVLRAVLEHGPVARSTVAERTGLSHASVTRHCAELIAHELVQDAPELVASKGIGRPHRPVDLGGRVVGAVHIAPEATTLAVLDLRGRVIANEHLPHVDTDPAVVLGAAVARLPRFLDQHSAGRRPLGVGVAVGGWVDPSSGVVVEHALLGWRGVPVRDIVARGCGLRVNVDSHARALARAELLFGSARDAASAVHLFVGDVVDAAIVTSGAVHHGPRSAAGAVAHLPLGDDLAARCPCGRSGCVQAAVSEQALTTRAVRDGVLTRPSIEDLLAAALGGHLAARALFVERARTVGRLVALLADVVNPEVLVVTEVGVLHLPESLAALRDEVRARSHACAAPQTAVRPTSFAAADVLAVAGGAVALSEVYANPLGQRGV
ncbi:ROK family transcriptional regulator [Actinophytocola sp.]|uniref:ROK family transcriptional regulator n=1 Tax=Actinophytocola sp. TaxID=1872138 RepID=UPI002ED09B5F